MNARTLGRIHDARVNDDGTFLFGGLDSGRYAVEAHARDFIDLRVNQNAPASDVEIVMRRGGTLRGRVVDKLTREPIKDFWVGDLEYHTEAEPGHQGRFALTGLDSGSYDVRITAENYAPRIIEDIRVEAGQETEEVLFELVKGATVLFSVTSAIDGTAISGAKIGPARRWFDDEAEEEDTPTTGKDGTCPFEHLDKGSYQFVVRHNEYADRKIAVKIVEEDERKQVDVLLDKGLTLHGRVVTRGDRVPIEGAKVKLFEEGSFTAGLTSSTNADGAFTLPMVPAGRYTVQAGHAGYAFKYIEAYFDPDFDEELTIELGPGIHLVVEVTNPDGSPHKDAGVMIFGPDVAGLGGLTDEKGHYVLEDCPPGRYHVRVGEAGKKGMGAFKEVDVPAGKETVLRFALGGGATVFGTISLNGKPMEEMYVYAWPKAVSSERTDYTWGLNCSTDEHGRYNIPGLQPDEYKLEVWVDDFTDAVPGREGCIVRRDFALGTEDLQLNVELGGDSVMGTVLDDTGTPLQDAAVGIIPIATADDRVEAMFAIRDTYTGWHSTDGLGRFTIMGIGEGTHRLTVSRAGYANKIVAIEKEAGRDLSNVVIKLEKESILLLRAHGTNGRAPDRIFIAVCDAEGRLLKEEELGAAAETGECRINGLPTGRLTIVAATRNYAPIREEVILQPGKGSILDLDFVPSHELGVTVLDNKGVPLPGAQVLLDPGGDVALASTLACGALAPGEADDHTDDTGALTFQHVADGDYTVNVLADDYEPAAAKVHITGADKELIVTLKPTKAGRQQ